MGEKMCKYTKDIPQSKTLPYPRVTFTSECGVNLTLVVGYNMDWRDYANYRKPVNPKGKCMKCKSDIEVVLKIHGRENEKV